MINVECAEGERHDFDAGSLLVLQDLRFQPSVSDEGSQSTQGGEGGKAEEAEEGRPEERAAHHASRQNSPAAHAEGLAFGEGGTRAHPPKRRPLRYAVRRLEELPPPPPRVGILGEVGAAVRARHDEEDGCKRTHEITE